MTEGVSTPNPATPSSPSGTERTASEALAERYEPSEWPSWATCRVHGTRFLAFCAGCAEEWGLGVAETARELARARSADPVARLLARVDRAVAPQRDVLAERHRLVPQLCQGATCACRPLAGKYAAGLLSPDLCSCPMSLRMNGEHAAGCEARHA